jgi:hypothetical protein
LKDLCDDEGGFLKLWIDVMFDFEESWIVAQKIEFRRGPDFGYDVSLVQIRSQQLEYLFRIAQITVFERGPNRMPVLRHQRSRPNKCWLHPCSPVNFLKVCLVANPLVLVFRHSLFLCGFERLGNALL